MSALDQLIPAPRLVEVNHVEIAAPPERIWDAIRHGDLGNLPVVRALFALRTRRLRIDEPLATRSGHGSRSSVRTAAVSTAING
jgi:hypothetical protein